jgi:hypothetical protein
MMFSYWAYVLVGEDETGKTTFQRNLIRFLCGQQYNRLPSNVVNGITHPRCPRGLETLFTANRSFQEKKSKYKSIENYFAHFFKDADLCFLSSHSRQQDVAEIIRQLRRRCFNVAGVFWSNAYREEEQEIVALPWTEVLWIHNPPLRPAPEIDDQLMRIAQEFCEMLISRAQSD